MGCHFLQISNGYYQQADLDTKQKMLSSIFPEKLNFSNGTYRTTKPSEVFAPLCATGNGFSESENKKTAENCQKSGWVVPTVPLSNQLRKELKQIYELKSVLPVRLLCMKEGRKYKR